MASQRIKGITIEIGGNTTKLQDSLKDVDKQLSKTKSALADVNKLLKMDPKNTELLAQKQKLLTDAIGKTKERLETLKDAQKHVTDPDQWDALQREIAATEQDLKGLETQFKNVKTSASDALITAGDKLKALGDKMTKAGETLTKNITLPLVAIGTAATKSAMEVDEGYDIITKKTGATGKAAKDLQDQMNRVFTTLPTDAQTAGNAIGEVATRFDLTGDACGDMAASFVRFADVTDQEVNGAIENTAKIMKQFGIETGKADEVMGALMTASQNSGVSMDTLYNALEKNGSTLKGMGLNLGKSVDLLAQFEANGIDSATALSAMKKAQQAATRQGKSFDTVLYRTANQIKNASTETEALQIATKTFGAKGAAPMVQAIREGRLEFTGLNGSMADYKDAVIDTYRETQDPWDKMKIAMNNVKVAGAELGSQLMTVLAPIIDKIAQSVQKFTKWFSSLSKGQQELIVKIGLLLAALGPVLLIGAKINQTVGPIISNIGKVGKAISGAGGLIGTITSLASAAGPFLIGGAIVAGIIAAVVLIVKNWGKIKKAAAALVKAVKKAWTAIGKTISDAAKKSADAAKKAWDGLKKATATAWTAVKTTVTNAAKKIKTVASTAWNGIKQAATTGWNSVKTATTTAWTNIKNVVSTSTKTVKTAISKGLQTAVSAATGVWSKLRTATSTAWHNVTNTVTRGAGNIRNATSQQLARVSSIFSSTWSRAKNLVGSTLSAIASSVRTRMQSVRQSFANAFTGIRIRNPFQDIMNKAYNAISYIKRLFNIKLSFPHIKMPHFSISGRFSLNPPQVPRINVRWYKKAYEDAMLFNKPTVLQTATGLKGFGDGRGGELVYGHKQLMRDIAAAKGGDTNNFYINGTGLDPVQIAREVERVLVAQQRQREAAYAS